MKWQFFVINIMHHSPFSSHNRTRIGYQFSGIVQLQSTKHDVNFFDAFYSVRTRANNNAIQGWDLYKWTQGKLLKHFLDFCLRLSLVFWMFWHAADLFLLKLGRLQNQRYQQHCAHKLHQPCKWKSMNVLGKRRWETWHTVTPNLCVWHRVTDFQNTTTHPHTHWHTHARTKGNMGGLQLHYFIVSKCECLWNTMQFFLGHKMDHITANLRWNGRATRSLWIQGVVCVSHRRHGQTTLASW